jgi:ATP-dependent DNA helicase RecG
MVIENAERFGLSQLHQLRGRVGRSNLQSHCTLISDAKNPIAKERIKLLCSTNNGFDISEKDLELRGPGELFGTAQHGLPTFKIANLYDDLDVLKEAQNVARDIAEILSKGAHNCKGGEENYREYLDYYNYAVSKTPKLINL